MSFSKNHWLIHFPFFKLCGLLAVFFLLVACGKDLAEERINMILLNTADIDLKDVKIERGRTAGTLYWYKFRVSPDWFEPQMKRLEKGGYSNFVRTGFEDFQAGVFDKSEWGDFFWHSSLFLEHKRYSVFYNERTHILTLIVFYH